MVFDRNPKFGADQTFRENATRVTDLLWETTGGQPSAIPQSYLENLRHSYENGNVSMLELIDRIDLPADATYDDYAEVIDKLICVNPEEWPEPDSVVSLRSDGPTKDISFSFAENFDDMSSKMEQFLKKIIATVYTDGVSDVSDEDGNPPCKSNNYLLSDDGKEFNGIFYDRGSDKPKSFPFSIVDKNGKWQIRY
jgi:hypothetical protein